MILHQKITKSWLVEAVRAAKLSLTTFNMYLQGIKDLQPRLLANAMVRNDVRRSLMSEGYYVAGYV